MNERTPPRLRGAPLLMARAAALIVSIGVAALLVLRAGAGGCRAVEADVEPEDRAADSTADPDYFPGVKADTKLVRPSPPAAASSDEPVFFPGSKADPHIVRRAPTPAPAPIPSASASAAATAAKPHYFPGSKAPAGDWADPDPPAGDGR